MPKTIKEIYLDRILALDTPVKTTVKKERYSDDEDDLEGDKLILRRGDGKNTSRLIDEIDILDDDDAYL